MKDSVVFVSWAEESDERQVIEHLRGLGLEPSIQMPDGEPAAAEMAAAADSSTVFVVGVVGPKCRAATKSTFARPCRDRLRALASDPRTIAGTILAPASRTVPRNIGQLKCRQLDRDGAWKEALTEQLRQTRFVVERSDLRRRVEVALARLGSGLFEREEAIRLSLLSALARESVFLLGPPGVAKSLMARRLKHVFAPGAKAFEYLMTRFSTPDEVFGPVSIRSLKQDRLRRITESYLPDATVVFLDEIWKAGPSIQNALLTVLNERIFRNGGRDEPVNLRALISASNELPAAGEGLGALWDRFLVRLIVRNVEQAENRHQLIRGGSQMGAVEILDEDRFLDRELEVIDRKIDRIPIPDEVLAVIDEIIARIQLHNEQSSPPDTWEHTADFVDVEQETSSLYVSDRRWKKIGRLLRASALLNGREAVDLIDCFLITHCIWDAEDQIETVSKMVAESIYETRPWGNLQTEWEALQASFDELPIAVSKQPKVFQGGFYWIKMDANRDRLAGRDSGKLFKRLSKSEYRKLGTEDRTVYLTEIAGQGRPARVGLQGRRGESALDIILEKPKDSAALGAFEVTRFRLIAAPGKRTAVDPESRRTRDFLTRLESFRQRVKNAEAAIDAHQQSVVQKSGANLFVALATEPQMRLRDSITTGEQELVDLGESVTRLATKLGGE